VVSVPPPAPNVPKTHHRVATVSEVAAPAPEEPPLRYDLEDGEPTLVGWQSPASTTIDQRWMWTLGSGAALVCLAAWWLHGL
ncbi:MAG: hypothetical protein WBM48_18545, partial [Polyangiales bacterium]